jgi:hypothetical protein
VSVNGWKRRLAKRGLALSLRPGNLNRWIAYVTAPGAPVDQRFSPLCGVGWADSYDEAIETALRDFQARREDQQREQVVLALAEPEKARTRVNTGSVAAVGPTR